MDNQFLDHGNIASLRYLFRSFSREALTTMKQLKLSEQDIPRFPPFSTLSVFTSVESLDLHKCSLASFPGALLVRAMPTLQAIDLSHNRLKDVESVLPLGQLKKLRDLHLAGNPMPYIELRTVLLQKLLYPEKRVHLKMVRIYTGMYRHPEFRVEDTRSLRKSMTLNSLLAKKKKPAPVPRIGSFPMLELLNGEPVTVDELEGAKPFPETDIYSSPQHPKPPPPASHLAPIYRSMVPKKSHHPCLVRHPQQEPTVRWLKVAPLVLNAATLQNRERAATQRTDGSFEASYLREDDSKLDTSSEQEDWPEEKWVSDVSMQRGKTTINKSDPFSPRSDTASRFSRLATMPSPRDKA